MEYYIFVIVGCSTCSWFEWLPQSWQNTYILSSAVTPNFCSKQVRGPWQNKECWVYKYRVFEKTERRLVLLLCTFVPCALPHMVQQKTCKNNIKFLAITVWNCGNLIFLMVSSGFLIPGVRLEFYLCMPEGHVDC